MIARRLPCPGEAPGKTRRRTTRLSRRGRRGTMRKLGVAARDPAHYGSFLKRDGAMVFTKDPRPAVEILQRTAPPDPPPIPAHLHAWWTSEGIAAGR